MMSDTRRRKSRQQMTNLRDGRRLSRNMDNIITKSWWNIRSFNLVFRWGPLGARGTKSIGWHRRRPTLLCRLAPATSYYTFLLVGAGTLPINGQETFHATNWLSPGAILHLQKSVGWRCGLTPLPGSAKATHRYQHTESVGWRSANLQKSVGV